MWFQILSQRKEPSSATIHLKATEQCFHVVVFVFNIGQNEILDFFQFYTLALVGEKESRWLTTDTGRWHFDVCVV